jgi:hypothetical protein
MTKPEAPTSAAVGSQLVRGVRPQKCSLPRCEGDMVQGFAMQQTYGGTSDFPGGSVVTLSPAGPGRMVGCWKCAACGWSVTAA